MTKFSTIIRNETERTIRGVPGRAYNVVLWAGNGSEKSPHEIANQKWVSETRRWTEGADRLSMRVTIRHDDNSRNGHPSFGMTVDGFTNGRADWGGAAHDEIAKHFPELVPLLRWHLCSTDGPMHYIANTCYHAGDRDHHGLRKGEVRQIKNGKTGLPCWRLIMRGPNGEECHRGPMLDLAEKPVLNHSIAWEPVNRIGEGKERDLDAARRSAVWPDATDADLMQDRESLSAALAARLPALVAEMRRDVESVCGMVWDAASAAKVEA